MSRGVCSKRMYVRFVVYINKKCKTRTNSLMHITTHNAFIFHSFGHLGLCLFIISNNYDIVNASSAEH